MRAYRVFPALLVLCAAGCIAQTTSPTSPDTIVVTSTASATDEVQPKHVGNGVSAPVLTHSAPPEYTDEARRMKLSGQVRVSLWVEEDGKPSHLRVVRGVGSGLDESAMDAIRQYRFRPGMEDGQPVVVELNIDVNFKIQGSPSVAPAAPPAVASVQSPPNPSANPPGVPVVGTPEAGGFKTIADRKRYAEDEKFRKAILELRQAGAMSPADRLAAWKHVSKVANNECVACLHTIMNMQMQQGQWKDAIATAKQIDTIGPDAKDHFLAKNVMGVALMHSNNDRPKPEQAQEALTALEGAMALTVGNKPVLALAKNTLFTQGRALAMLNRDAEASKVFQQYVDMVSYGDSLRTRAEHFVANPQLASMPMAPPFTLTTSEGEQMSLDDMGGKVVLLDFWATWCGPCKESLPDLQRLAKNFAGQPLVVISISSDSNDIAWKEFIDKNHMTWPQYRDANGALNRAYGVASIPRYFTIDTDGVLQSVKVGSGADIDGEVRKLVNKVRDAEKKKAKETQRASAGL